MSALVLALLAVPAIHAPAPVSAQKDAAAARAFVDSIYLHYRADGPGAPLGKPELFFEPVLARAIRADQDQADKSGDLPRMDADPFCVCQDYAGMTDPVIGAPTVRGDRATVDVAFSIGGEKIEVRFHLVWTRAGWRIFDLDYPEGGGSTRAMYFPKD